jgi:para-aminobenzoate synthetase component I
METNRVPRPLHRELLSIPSVVGACERLSRLPYPVLFHSATSASDISRYSFAAAGPRTVVRSKGVQIDCVDSETGTVVRTTGRALDLVAQLVYGSEGPRPLADDDESLPPFQGGAAGYIGYEYGAVLECIPQPHDDLALPDVVLGIYEWTIAWDHASDRCWIFGTSEEMLDSVAALIRDVPANLRDEQMVPPRRGAFASTFTRETYPPAVERVREYIRAGDIFQVNLSQRFSAPLRTTPWILYQTLQTINPAPFAAYFDAGDVAVAITSPERFLHVDPAGRVETRPIKGTRPRALDPRRDAELRDELLHSEKDAAEHVMIVDVLRNDLARVCEYGSVRVPTLMRHEPHESVHHLVSIITGQLRRGLTAVDLLHASFPGGSITGAPKIRAMEIIAELEPVTRGVYCGAIGYLSVTGAMDTSIAIRTCVTHDDRVYFSAGGGVVADSDPIAEYEETLVKAAALMQAVSSANASSRHPTPA